jgi:LacI family transcriptional regulator
VGNLYIAYNNVRLTDAPAVRTRCGFLNPAHEVSFRRVESKKRSGDMAKSANLREVAKLAGVSLPTASRALTNKTNVLPETRAKVLKAAAQLGYRMALRGETIPERVLDAVGVVVKRDPGAFNRIDPFNYDIVSAIEDECQTLALNIFYASIDVDPYGGALEWPRHPNGRTVDGLIIVGPSFDNRVTRPPTTDDKPIVLVDSYISVPGFSSVLIDNVHGAYHAVSYLIAQGHRAIGLIGSVEGFDQHPGIQERRTGYLDALRQHGIDRSYIEESQLHQDEAFQATQQLLRRAPEVTAIFACNDNVGVSVVQAVQAMGLRVPHDVSVIGFDNTSESLESDPPLATVMVDRALMGAMAVRMLYEQAVRERNIPMTLRIGTQLVERGSVQPSQR